MKFSIAGKIYDAVDMQDLSMLDILRFESQVKEVGRAITWSDVTQWQHEMAAMKTDAERAEHPEALWMTAATVWVVRRAAGEDVTFAQAVDVPADSIRMISEPEDHKKPAGKARKPRTAGGAHAKAAAGATSSVEP